MTDPKVKGYGGSSGNWRGYVVEVRTSYPDPQAYGDFIVDGNWRRVPVEFSVKCGIPNRLYCKPAEDLGLMSYECAIGIAAWFVAGAWPFGSCLQTRLVEVEVKWTITTEEVGVGRPTIWFEEERNAKYEPRN